ncbi:SMI1/KNR4 family protein [Actinomadura miaoliensis]|uniref:Knr4/Smi1-like domain-containing protein n=1 Tax=Actinomadura miaoliensis TaxID=430685 RepID=A0ABP7UXQ1_9ACTN
MRRGVDDSWDVIVDWLLRHCPHELDAIGPPAAEDDIREAERTVGTALPDDLVAWWRRADGQAGLSSLLPPFYTPCSIQMALDSRKIRMTVWNGVVEQTTDPAQFAAFVERENRASAGTPCTGAWLPRWLPIAGDGGGSVLFVDLRPGPAHGCVRRFFRDGGAGDAVWWGGVAEMLADVAAGLTQEVPVHGYRVWVEDDGRMSWDSAARRWSTGGNVPVNVARLRERYAAFVAEARAGGFNEPAAGSWPADWIAAHVVRSTELLLATTQAVLADDPAGREQQRAAAWAAQDWTRHRELMASAERAAAGIRYDNYDAMAPATLARYAGSGLGVLADQAEQLGARLCDLVEPLNQGRPIAHVRIVDQGTTIIDGPQGWLGVLNALEIRQLPLRTRQLRALR